MKPDIYLAYALSSALAYTSNLTETHANHAQTVAEIATILGMANDIIHRGLIVNDDEHIILHQAGIITSTLAPWKPAAAPYLEEVRKFLQESEELSEANVCRLIDRGKQPEGVILNKALATALGNLARAAGALSVVYSALEESRFKDFFDVDRLLRIAETSGKIIGEIGPLKLPDLSNPEL